MNGWHADDQSLALSADHLDQQVASPSHDRHSTARHGAMGKGREGADNPLMIDGQQFDVSQEVGFLMRRVQQRVTSLFQQRMKDYDLTPTQFASLCKMAEIDEVSQNQLGRLVNLDPATNQGVVRRVMKRGLIARRDDPNDRRRSLLRITQDGRNLLVDCLPTASRVTPAILKPLSQEERVQLLDMLKRLG
ncbi:MAG: MarR family winged helix-turn-helix transcriptional regulator [Pseudomonadota bacterium]